MLMLSETAPYLPVIHAGKDKNVLIARALVLGNLTTVFGNLRDRLFSFKWRKNETCDVSSKHQAGRLDEVTIVGTSWVKIIV